jgi:SAM-dependent methyltransferase
MTPTPLTENPAELSKIYQTRFSGQTDYRMGVWKILIRHLFSLWIPKDGEILDLGAGHGEFINQVKGKDRSAMDMNPDTARFLDPEVRFIQQSCCEPWPVSSNTLDLIFTSNFFEHLPDKNSLKQTLQQAYQALKPGGTLIIQGYGKAQMQYQTGGPGILENLYDEEMLLKPFKDYKVLDLKTYLQVVDEGPGHSGMSSLVGFIAQKP